MQRCILFFRALAFVYCTLSVFDLPAQMTVDMRAMVNNAAVAIRVKNTAILNTRFNPDSNGIISLDFFFDTDHPRNGTYLATPVAQNFGEIELVFSGLPYVEGDSLTFSVIEELGSGILVEYIFIQGEYRSGAGGAVTVCPIRLECSGANLFLIFDKADVTIGLSSVAPVSIFTPGANLNGHYTPGSVSLTKNAIVLRGVALFGACEAILTGRVVVSINGLTCVFENGTLISVTPCSPWSGYYTSQENCAGVFENCAPALIQLLSENKQALPCRQWKNWHNQCGTSVSINREGKVAIGTTGFSSARLTVKNGIITDRVKVQLPAKMGWGDYVFLEGYNLPALDEVEAFIQARGHLPGVPAGDTIKHAGSIDLAEITAIQQVKVEEIFLYLIRLEEELTQSEQLLALFAALENIGIK